jgi:hypothetical protein
VRRPAVAVVLAAAVALGGCGGGETRLSQAPPPVDLQVRAVFAEYTRAMARGDWGTACAHLAPESIEKLRLAAGKLARIPPNTCPAVLRLVVRSSSARDRARLREIASTARVRRVLVGDDGAFISWWAVLDGKRVPVAQALRRVGRDYRLVSITR